MPDRTPQVKNSDAFCQVIQDVLQFISDQKELGNTRLNISAASKETIKNWKNPSGMGSALGADFISKGPEDSQIWFVDREASFFNGESGALLKKMIHAMNLDPANVFICNCKNQSRFENEIKTHGPSCLVFLGEPSIKFLTSPFDATQGQFVHFLGIPTMPTYHPKDLLDHPELKRPAWDALQKVMEKMGLKK